jgi:hypothetical protein
LHFGEFSGFHLGEILATRSWHKKETVINRKDFQMKKLLGWLMPMALSLVLLAPQSGFSQGCG